MLATVVYAWQEIGKRLEIASGKSKGQSVLGFMWQGCERFESFVFEGSITSHIVINCINEIIGRLAKPTVIVMDNAPIHHSEEFEESIEEWERQAVEIYYLPKYSSELNKIELLWKKIKHEWLSLEAYQSYQRLTEELDKVLSKIGSLYKIILGLSYKNLRTRKQIVIFIVTRLRKVTNMPPCQEDSKSFFEKLQNAEGLDLRDNRGKRHDLAVILVGVTIAVLSNRDGCLSSIHRHLVNHYEKLVTALRIKKERAVSRSQLPLILEKVAVPVFDNYYLKTMASN